MTVDEKIFALWSADATATALVPAGSFKPAGIYQNLTLPYVIHWPVASRIPRTMAEGAVGGIEIGTRQFSIYADGETAMTVAESIRQKLISVFDGNKGGFNFHYAGLDFMDKTLDDGVLLIAVSFLVTSVPS